jgi:hypothetical protein
MYVRSLDPGMTGDSRKSHSKGSAHDDPHLKFGKELSGSRP